jgi:hypothetical protein
MPDEPAEQEQTENPTDEAAEETEQVTTGGGADEENTDRTGGDQSQEDKPADQFDAKRAQEKIRKANSEAAGLRKRLKELEPLAAKAKKLEDAQKTETERLQAELTEREKQIDQIRRRAVTSEVRSLAADLFADKTDPEAHLDLNVYVGDDGDIDTDQITVDLADLLARKPHLGKAKPDTERRRPAPDRTQASSAKQASTKNPADEFAGFFKSQLRRSS